MDLLDTPKCELEKECDWEKRPIRDSQIHYAAMEAFIQLEFLQKLKLMA